MNGAPQPKKEGAGERQEPDSLRECVCFGNGLGVSVQVEAAGERRRKAASS